MRKVTGKSLKVFLVIYPWRIGLWSVKKRGENAPAEFRKTVPLCGRDGDGRRVGDCEDLPCVVRDQIPFVEDKKRGNGGDREFFEDIVD